MSRTGDHDVLGILGLGHFGRAMASLADAAGVEWLGWDVEESRGGDVHAARLARDLDDLVSRSGQLVLCVPVPTTEAVLDQLRPKLSPEHLVLDVGSVKAWPTEVMARVLGTDIPWCATHPLFGPVSLSRGERPLRVVVCPNDHHAAAPERARAFYELLGCEVTEMTPDEHDRHMAETHALAFFVARAMLDLEVGHGSELVTPSFRAMAQTVETVRGDAGHLFDLIQRGNPHAAEARRRFIEALRSIDAELVNPGPDA